MKNQYVCHAGVKGMKWGVRKKQDPYSNPRQKKSMSPEAKRKLKIAGGIAVGIAVAAVGTYAVSKAVKSKQAKEGARWATHIMERDQRIAMNLANNNPYAGQTTVFSPSGRSKVTIKK